MRRRQFIAMIGGAAAAWPLFLRAQQKPVLRRIGVLMGVPEGDPEYQSEAAALKRGLQELGWTEGRNLQTEYRWAGAEPDRIQASAAELVALACEVIVARSTLVVEALLRETHSIPIVFTVVVDPVGSGFAASLARPGGNVTGFQNYEFTMTGKWLQILMEIAPQVRRVAFLYNPITAPPGFLRSLNTVASSYSVQPIAAAVHDSGTIEAALAALAREPGGGLIVIPDIFNIANRALIIGLAAKGGLPAIYPSALHTKSGGLLSYGPDTPDLFRRAASYVDRILKGEKPAELPVQQPTKYELTINLKTAKALGIAIPPTLLAVADELIE
jgi:putative tryptophan/tyrosine transport system substrate-binding protein